ncbi:di-heme oxidoredictase family protein [Nannocystis pusilla]|uniref:di-heme oxidoredictase family protein n=1 Tax=Nannocystis pusilla TaxID=889268 RepID=UPI003B7CDF20
MGPGRRRRGARPLRLEGQPADRRPADRRRLPRRHGPDDRHVLAGELSRRPARVRRGPARRRPEVSPDLLDDVIFYSATLAVPARRDAGAPEVLRGKQVFLDAGCADCHVPRHRTADDAAIEEVRGQTIWPYTDLLLHDMGDALGDGRRDYLADGNEWRTPPLWGIGLVETVNGHTTFLHDGRARSLMEAVLWHGGEAEPAREAVRALPAMSARPSSPSWSRCDRRGRAACPSDMSIPSGAKGHVLQDMPRRTAPPLAAPPLRSR